MHVNPPVRQAVGAIAIRDGAVLLLQRRTEDFRGDRWEIPSGIVEVGEEFEAALRREFAEETGLEITAIHAEVGRFRYRGSGGEVTTQRNYLVDCAAGPVTLTEHQAYRWVPRFELAGAKLSLEVHTDVSNALAVMLENTPLLSTFHTDGIASPERGEPPTAAHRFDEARTR